MNRPPFIHPTADVSSDATVKDGVVVWNYAQVREQAVIGEDVIVSKGAYIDHGVRVGRNCKIQNNASVYHGVTLEEGVFVGPHVCFTNDLRPRAINPDGSRKAAEDWTVAPTLVKRGASIGAHSVIVAGVTIGSFALVGAGSVVTRDVPDFGLVYGNPARLRGFVDAEGHAIEAVNNEV
jgi:acetyltransferase-like isoleucine patch superfamily enzyme